MHIYGRPLRRRKSAKVALVQFREAIPGSPHAPTPAPAPEPEPRGLAHESWERFLPFIGVFLAAVIAAEIAITWSVDALLGPVMLQTVLAELFPGREAAIPLGLTGHIDELWLWQLTWTVDWAYFCFLYPVFLTVLHRRQGKGGFFMRRFEKLEQAARKNQKFTRRWGPLGVFLFMMTPFLVNGPLVGMILGRLSGIHTRRLLIPVGAANLIGNGIMIILFDKLFWEMRKLSGQLDRYVAIGMFGFLFTAAVIALAVDEIRERRRRRRSRVLS